MVFYNDIIKLDDDDNFTIDYNEFEILDYDKLNMINSLDYINYINYFINDKIGDYEKNILIENKLYDKLSLKINNYFNTWCKYNKLFIEKPIIKKNKNNEYLQSNISIDFIFVLFSFYNLHKTCEKINNNCENYFNLIISLTKNVKKYFIETLDEQINNMIVTLNDLDYLTTLANDFEIIKNMKNELDLEEFNDIHMKQIDNEFGEINYFLNLYINKILEKITKNIISDFNEYKNNNLLKNLSVDVIIVTLQDYFTDLLIWMLKPNLLKLIEKIDIEIISSNLIIQLSKPRDEFEEFIRKMIEKIILIN